MYKYFLTWFVCCTYIICLNSVLAQECVEPKNCIVSEWNIWSECTETCGESGTRTRTRTVFQEASCGGSCPFDVKETEPCNIFCCPVDCVFTPWSSWKFCHCSANGCEEDGERYKCKRLREKLSSASCGGYCDEVTAQEACGALCCYKDCVLSLWSLWTICDAPCEQEGLQNRTRSITQAPICGGKPCGSTIEHRSCMGDCCPVHCVLGEWGEWSTCNTSCGEAIQTRQRFVQLPQCNGEPCIEDPVDTETRQCSNYINTDCEVSAWSPWTTCYLDNGFCGKGSKYRSRHVVTSPVCQGIKCGNLTETGDCNGPCCRQDCQLSEWSVWGHCSSSCGQGLSNRTRTVTSWPSCGGSPCSSNMVESRGCVVTDVINCEFTNWSNWTTCSNDCGEGVVIRSRTMITPSFCGGSCENEMTYEENVCESFTARQDCEVSDWSEWSQCERSCEGGIERRNRTVISNPICGGTLCPNITETRRCHELCEQLCTAGTCRCQLGFRLNSNNYTCTEIVCPLPRVEYCPDTHRYLKDCRYPQFECLTTRKYNATCDPYCSTDWTLKGSPPYVTCREDGTWSQPNIFCARPNDLPVNIEIDNTVIEENTPKDACIAYLSTITTTRDMYETHTYNITDSVTGRLYAKYNRVCLTRTANYEEKPNKWNATIHTYDIEGQSISVVFEFEILNANDPPTSVTLEPNVIPENSPNGTIVGCFIGTDDEEGQTITFNMIDSDRNTFGSYTDDNGKTCLKVVKGSDPRCYEEGGVFCVLNKELKPVHHVTVIATDDGNPPMSAVFDVPIHLSDVNDKQTAVIMEPAHIPENIEPGEPLVKLIVVDEDVNQTYTFRLIQDADGLFQIKDDYLTATKTFDYEQNVGVFYSIEVEATDQSEPTLVVASELKVYVQDFNESPYKLQLTSVGGILQFDLNTPRVNENSRGILGTVTVKDEDFNDTVDISIEHNEDTKDHLELANAKCAPDANKLIVCTANLIINLTYNFEEINSVNLILKAIDKKGLNTTIDLLLDVIDVNDPPKALLFNGQHIDVLTIEENQRDIALAQLTTTDEDSNDLHKYEIINAKSKTFIIEGNTLKTAYQSNINYETQDNYVVTIQVTDNGTPSQSTNFNVTISVTDINEPPTSTLLSSNNVSEHAPFGTVVGTLSSEDPDNAIIPNKQKFQYTLSDDSLGRFVIDGNKLKTKLSSQLCGVKACRLDFETEPIITLKIITMDDGVPRLQREDKLVVMVTDANDPPTDIRIDASTIKENEPPGKMIGTLFSSDEDEQDIATYSVADFTDIFEIRDGDKLYASVSLDFEMLNSYWLTIVAKDNGNPSSENSRPIVIRVIDVNEQPIFSMINNSLTISDDTILNESIATLVVSDPDTADAIEVRLHEPTETFALSLPRCSTLIRTGATECFIDVILTKELDVTKKDNFILEATATDKHSLETKENMQILVEDVNNAPSEILLNGISVSELTIIENTLNIKVSDLKAVDKDQGQTHTYTIVENPNSFFVLEGSTLMISSTASIDFESMKDMMILKLSVQDSGDPQLSYVKDTSIIITDVNEVPAGVTLYPNKVMENSIGGTVIGNISVTDPEDEQTHTLKLVNDANGVFVLDGTVLKVNNGGKDCTAVSGAGCRINYENRATYNVSIEVLDNGIPPLRGVFDVDIHVIDMNEPPWNIRLKDNKFKLGSEVGTVIGSLSVHDDDIDQTHSFNLLGISEYIGVSRDGQVTVLDSGNLIEGQIFEVIIEATDSGISPLSTNENIKLIVVGTNVITVEISPKPPVKLISDGILIEENTPIDSVIGIVTMQYPVMNVDILVEVSEGDTHINVANIQCSNDQSGTTCTAEIRLTSGLDFETMMPIDIVLQSSAGDSKSLDYLRIEIEDINEAPKAVSFSSGTISVPENSPDQLLGQFSVLDDDVMDSYEYTISGDGENFLTLKEFGKLFSKSDVIIDFETMQAFNITVIVTDSGGLSLTEEFSVTVINVNEAPISLDISNNEVNEMASEGTEVGIFEVNDYDAGQTHTFELVSDPTSAFNITGSKLMVQTEGSNCQSKGGSSCFLDYESDIQHSLVVKVTDSGTPPLSNKFTIVINIIDVNDPPRSVVLTSNKMLENQPLSYEIASVSAYDDDIGQIISFNILENPYVLIEEDRLLLKQEVSYETTNELILSIISSDNGTPFMSTTTEFTITIIDVNEPPSSLIFLSTAESVEQFDDDKPVIRENVPELTFIGQMVLLDPDIDETVTIYSQTTDVVTRNVRCIPVTSGTRCTADVWSARIFDFETTSSVPLRISATDKEGLQIILNVSLIVLDINDPPTNIYLNGSDVRQLDIPENSKDIMLVQLTVEDKEVDQSYVFTFTDKISFLTITGDEIWITSAADLNYEENEKYDLTLQVSDNGVPPASYSIDIIVRITDVNEEPNDLFLSSNKILETAAVDNVVGLFIVDDPDNTNGINLQEFSFELLEESSSFKIFDGTLMVKTASFDYESRSTYNEVIIVSDNGVPNLSATFTVTIEVVDVNETPNHIDFTGLSVKENMDLGKIVGQLTAKDPDEHQNFVYEVIGSNVLSINGDVVVVNGHINYETNNRLIFTIRVSDNGSPPLSLEQEFVLEVTDVNEVPSSISVLDNTDMTISESFKAGSKVATIILVDEDITERLELILLTGSDVLQLGELTCSVKTTMTECVSFLTLKTPINYEAGSKIVDISLKATDKGGLSLQSNFQFSVKNENDPPTDILLDTDIESVPENTANFVIGTLNTIDQDNQDSHVYIVTSPWEMFTVIGNKLTTTSQLNYEHSTSHTVYIRSRDDGNPAQSLTKPFIINVKDVNEAPSDIAVSPNEIATDITTGQVVAQVKVSDPDNFGRENFQKHTCIITPTDVLQIDNTNLQIKVSGSLPPDVTNYGVTITCTDIADTPLSMSVDFTFSVVDIVDVPKDIQLLDDTGSHEISVNENVVDVVIGQLSVINILTKSVIPSNVVFSVIASTEEFSINGASVKLIKMLNFETKPFTEVQVSAVGTDSAGNFIDLTSKFLIVVRDVNEAPTGIDISGMRSVNENAAEDTFIGDLITYDPETYQTYTYTLLGVNYGMVVTENDVEMLQAFSIDGDVLTVGTDNHLINFEVSDIMTLLINTKDSGDPAYDLNGLVHLKVNDGNDPPTDVLLSNNQVAEDSNPDTLIGTFTVVDEDLNQHHMCELLNLIDVPFKIINGTSLVVSSPVLDYESKMAYTVEVTCGDTLLDGTRLRYTKSFIINVTNVNEPPFNITLSSYVVQERNLIGQVIAEIKAVDLDSSKIFYTLVEENDWTLFHIEGYSTLVTDTEFNYESPKRFYTITIRAEDDMGAFAIDTMELEVHDVNEAPEEIVLDIVYVNENTLPGTKIGVLSTVDPDRNQQFIYSIETDVFVIDGDRLIVGETGLDYETITSYELLVTTTDNGTPPESLQQVIRLDIIDSNDRPASIITGQIDAVPENSPINTVLLTFTVDDPDEGQRHSCYVESIDNMVIVTKGSGEDDMNLVLSGRLDYETFNTLDIHLSCTDGEFEIAKEMDLPIEDINEAPTSITLTGSNTILSDASPGTIIGTLTVEDGDIGQAHSFVINGQNSDILKISNQNELTLISSLPQALLTSLDSSLKFTVTVADNGSPVQTYNETIIVLITNVVIELNGLPQIASGTFKIKSTFVAGDIVGSLFSQDLVIDASVNVVLLNNPFDLFTIVNNSVLVMASDINGVTETSITINVEVRDSVTLEQETYSIIVLIEMDLTCFEDQCTEHESCVSVNETYHKCDCNNDFNRNNEGVCTKINHCDVNTDVCLNGGRCVDEVDGYVCQCVDGFSGTNCEIRRDDQNVCETIVCHNSGICVPNEDKINFDCICKQGWSGLYCDVSIDDCIDSVCFNDGKCIDKHLTYICQCDEMWKGLRCEYHRSVCSELNCNDDKTCVGRILSNETLCVSNHHLLRLSYNQQENSDLSVFQARLVGFIIKHGRFTRTESSTSRKKRQTESVTYNEDIEIYVSEANEVNDKYIYTMVIMDSDGPLTRANVLNELSITCKRINSEDQIEDIFCPSILSAAVAEKKPSLPSGSNGGLIAGVVVMVILLIVAAVLIGLFIMKKNKSTNKITPMTSQTRDPELQARDHEGGSANGYASMPQVETSTTQQDAVAVPEVKTIQVLPANLPIDNARYESTA